MGRTFHVPRDDHYPDFPIRSQRRRRQLRQRVVHRPYLRHRGAQLLRALRGESLHLRDELREVRVPSEPRLALLHVKRSERIVLDRLERLAEQGQDRRERVQRVRGREPGEERRPGVEAELADGGFPREPVRGAAGGVVRLEDEDFFAVIREHRRRGEAADAAADDDDVRVVVRRRRRARRRRRRRARGRRSGRGDAERRDGDAASSDPSRRRRRRRRRRHRARARRADARGGHRRVGRHRSSLRNRARCFDCDESRRDVRARALSCATRHCDVTRYLVRC
eukprot:29425-Pelagococcus_subviridis.AAC.3